MISKQVYFLSKILYKCLFAKTFLSLKYPYFETLFIFLKKKMLILLDKKI